MSPGSELSRRKLDTGAAFWYFYLMSRLTLKYRKTLWMRWLAAAMGMLLILNLSPAFCACLDDHGAPVGQGDTSSNPMSCHCSKPTADNTAEETENGRTDSSSQADTCPLCTCTVSAAGSDFHNAAVAKGGSSAPHPLAMIAASKHTPLEIPFQGLGADPPRRASRFVPLHLLNSAFLL